MGFTRDRNCPVFMRSDARYALVESALTDEWRAADQISNALHETGADVRYQLTRLVADGKAERQEGKNAFGRKRNTFRRIQIPSQA